MIVYWLLLLYEVKNNLFVRNEESEFNKYNLIFLF